jgi:hypothetical protein
MFHHHTAFSYYVYEKVKKDPLYDVMTLPSLYKGFLLIFFPFLFCSFLFFALILFVISYPVRISSLFLRRVLSSGI